MVFDSKWLNLLYTQRKKETTYMLVSINNNLKVKERKRVRVRECESDKTETNTRMNIQIEEDMLRRYRWTKCIVTVCALYSWQSDTLKVRKKEERIQAHKQIDIYHERITSWLVFI